MQMDGEKGMTAPMHITCLPKHYTVARNTETDESFTGWFSVRGAIVLRFMLDPDSMLPNSMTLDTILPMETIASQWYKGSDHLRCYHVWPHRPTRISALAQVISETLDVPQRYTSPGHLRMPQRLPYELLHILALRDFL